MTRWLTSPGSQPAAIANTLPLIGDTSTQELHNKRNAAIIAISALLSDTNWPLDSNKAAQNLLQTINHLPDLPADVQLTPIKDTVVELIRVLEGVHARVKEVSEKYGRRERGFKAGIKYNLSSLRSSRCTDTLQTCRVNIEKASTNLHNCFNNTSTSGQTSTKPLEGSESPSELNPPPTIPLVGVENHPEPLEPSQAVQTEPAEQALVAEHPASHQAPLQDSSPDLVEDRESHSPARDGVLIAARKTFKTVEAVSRAIPGVGDFVGVAAKVGLVFVNMIETMDQNEEVSKELVSHTSKLSSCLQYFKRRLDVENADEVATHIEDLHMELERVQKKVSTWNSLGRFKKAFLSSDHADQLKAHQNTVQTILEEMQARLLVSIKAADLVIELKNTELRAERTRLLDRLGDGSYGARGTTIEDVVCLPGTRIEILNRIDEWVKDTSPSANRVLWIRGMAGRGKSTIASTVAHNWVSKGSCAIFHFRRGQNASDGQFICSLARQLGKGLISEVKNAILDCVRENEDIAKERLGEQFKTLFVGSLGQLQDHAYPIVIIVDALDECKDENDAVRFVRLIDQNSSLLPVNVKFLLTCRPEAPLLVALEPRKWHAEELDSISDVSEDITRFIQHACAQIRGDHNLPEDWPSSADLKGVVEMSQGLFQWARTAIAYIGKRSPEHRLQELLRRPTAWGELDYLYCQILSRAFKEVEQNPMRKQVLSWVLGTLVVAPYPVTLEIIAFLHADHEIFKDQANTVQFLRNDILADLNSLLHIPTSPSDALRLMHTSIQDLLTARERCKNQCYFVDAVQDHQRLASVSLEIMGRDLKQNICNLPLGRKANSEIQDVVDIHVTKGLRYCCRSWSIHLIAGFRWSEATVDATRTVLAKFERVSNKNILSWLEVMSLIGALTEAHTIANQVHGWLLEWARNIPNDSLNTLWNDTSRFIAAFFEQVSFSALEMYASALPRCPVETQLWAKYGGLATAWHVVGPRQRNWSANLWTSSTNSAVATVAFSPDGHDVASGSAYGAVRLWDAQTGAPLGQPLTGESNQMDFVAFSPDGKVLACGSADGTVRLWDAKTGAPLGQPLTGHGSWIPSGVFSPDSKVLACGSANGTVRLWETQTGAPLGQFLTGHSEWMTSVAFSPDGKVLASGSYDKTVRLWDAQTRTSLGQPLTGHGHYITSVVFSPDGKVLASGSYDKTVRLWDAQTRAPLGQPLTGHSWRITSVAFSLDGKVLASGSEDKTVRLWDVQTGAPLSQPLTGHSDSINSVVFSPNGKVLASGSNDTTVRLWDAQTGAPLDQPLTGHGQYITSIVFSPDGKVLASGSLDRTIRLWDAQTGALLAQPLTGHSDSITSVAFSPDGKVLASVSRDETVRFWDAQTGAALGEPFTGHGGEIMSIAFLPGGKVLASDDTVRVWDAQIGAPLGEPLTSHSGWIYSAAFSPDGKVLASGSDDKKVRLWDVQTGAPLGKPLIGHNDSINSVVFSPEGKVLASGSDDTTVRLWDAQTGAPLGQPLTGHSHYITSVVFSPDGKVLASGSLDRTIRLWDAQTGALLAQPLIGHTGWISSVAFSPDGKVLASAAEEDILRFWDPLTHRVSHPLVSQLGS